MQRQDNLIWTMQLIRRQGTQVSWFPVSYSFYHALVLLFGISGTKWINYEKPEDSWASQWAATVCERPAERKCLSKYNILWHVILLAELLYCDLGWEPTTLKDMSQEDKNWRRQGKIQNGHWLRHRMPFWPLGRTIVLESFWWEIVNVNKIPWSLKFLCSVRIIGKYGHLRAQGWCCNE